MESMVRGCFVEFDVCANPGRIAIHKIRNEVRGICLKSMLQNNFRLQQQSGKVYTAPRPQRGDLQNGVEIARSGRFAKIWKGRR